MERFRRSGVPLSLSFLLIAGGEVEREVVGFPPGDLPYQAHFVGSERCGGCHTEHYQKQRHHPMALTGRAVTPENASLWFSDERLKKPVSWRGADVPAYRTTPDGAILESGNLSARVGAVLGSGARGFTPIAAEGTFSIRELRLSFSSHHDSWLMTPGSERERDPLGPPQSVEQSRECLECHSTTIAWKDEILDFEESNLGIQCERCHGPGSAHLKSVEDGNPSAIFNPAVLRADQQAGFCGQCHRTPADLDPLDVMTGNPSIARHAGAGLMLSECFRRSPSETTITCLDCHDPHSSVESADRFRASCLRCHQTPAEDHRSEAVTAAADCVSCHMPLETNSFQGMSFRSHWIRRPESPPPLDAFERGEYLEYLEMQYQAAFRPHFGPEKKARYRISLAEVVFARQKHEEALRWLREGLSFSPSYGHRLRAAALLEQAGLSDEANESLELAKSAKPWMVEAYYQQGELLQHQGKFDQAAARFQAALEIDPALAPAYDGLGSALLSQGRIEDAIVNFRKALELDPGQIEARNHLGRALAIAGRWDEAMVELRQVVRERPSLPGALDTLARILATHPDPETRKPEEAIRLADRAAELTGYEHPAILETLAISYAAAGQFEKAAAVAEEAQRLASAGGANDLASRIGSLLQRYRERRP